MKPPRLALALLAFAFALPASADLLSDEYKQKLEHSKQVAQFAQSLAKTMQDQVPFKLNSDMTVTKVGAINRKIVIHTTVHFSNQQYMRQESFEGPDQGWLGREIRMRAAAEICNTPTLNDFIAIGGVVKVSAFRGKNPPSITGFGPYVDKCP